MRRYLLITVFFAGMTSLAVEFSASRLLGNYFGTSNLVWASIIGLILLYLTAGYFLGGYWADRFPRFQTFYSILTWAAFLIGLIPLASRPVLIAASAAFDQLQLGVLFGSFAAVLILFSVPVTLLGTTSPFAIRLAIQDMQQSGKTAGKIYSISTLGSFIGTFLPVLLLIPLIGTFRTFLFFSELLLVIALIGLGISSGIKFVWRYSWMPIVILLLAIFGMHGNDKNSTGLIYETESAYNYIQVQEIDGYRLLRLNEGQGVHSIWHPDILSYYGPWEQVLIAPFFNSAHFGRQLVQSMAIVGLAAGTTARQASEVYPDIQIDGFELDPVIVEVGREYFDMNEPNLNVIIQDGRIGLENSTRTYQIISIDAYRPPYIPWHLTTREFFQTVFNHLTADGVMVINVGRSPTNRSLINALFATIRSVFPSAHIVDLPYSFNSLIFATVQPTTDDNLLENYQVLIQMPNTPQLLIDTIQVSIAGLQPEPEISGIVPFTDDLAPIEWLTNNLILSYLMETPTGISQ